MATPNPLFFAMQPLQQVIFDKDDGELLAAGIVSYFSDPQFTTPKDIYEQSNAPDGSYIYTNIGSVVELSAIGSFVDPSGENFIPFAFPWTGTPENPGEFEPYYITVYSAGGVLQFTITGWPANDYSNSSDTSSTFEFGQNILTNPQFSEVLFNNDAGETSYTISVTGTQETVLAPGWFLLTTGSGDVVLSQLSLAATPSSPSDTPYSLSIELDDGVTAVLYQRIYMSPRLLYGRTIAGYFEAASLASGSPVIQLQMTYVPSNGSSAAFDPGSTSGGDYTAITGFLTLDGTINPDEPGIDSGYIDIQISIPDGADVGITSVQVIAVSEAVTTEPVFIQQSTPQQQSLLFWYWQQPLNFKPVPSLLIGWDFPLNPSQFGSSGTITNVGVYLWDQTIGASGSGVPTYARNSITGGIQVTATDTDNAYYLLQYLDAPQAQKILGTQLSVNINAYKTAASADIIVRVYLARGSSAASFPSLGTTIGTLSSSGTFSVNAANWTIIPRGNFGVANSTLNVVSTNDQINDLDNDIAFSGWEITDATQIGNTDKFAIVVTFAYTTANSVVTVNSISLTPGQIPTRPAPLSYDETLLACSRYYQKSFAPGVNPAQNAGSAMGETYGVQNAAASTAQYGPSYNFPVPLRAVPTMTFYNPQASNAQIYNNGTGTSYTGTTFGAVSQTNFISFGTSPGGSAANQLISVNWTADARLGVV